MRVRLIVADPGEARFYDLDGMNSRLEAAGQLIDTESPPQEQAPSPEDPQHFNRAVVTEAGRRVSSAARVAGAEPRPRKDAAMRFARQIAAALDAAKRKNEFDRIVLVAGPHFIGLLRSALPEAVRATLVAEVRKDLLAANEEILQGVVPPEAFS